MGRGRITVWVTEYTDRWAYVVTYLCVHSESKMFHFSERDLDPTCGSLDPQVGISIGSAVFLWSTNKSDRPTDRQTDRPRYLFCDYACDAADKRYHIAQLRFVRALAVNLSCQSTADTPVDVCGEVMSSDSSLLRFGRTTATYRQASVHQRDVGFDALFNIPKLLMQNLTAVFHKKWQLLLTSDKH